MPITKHKQDISGTKILYLLSDGIYLTNLKQNDTSTNQCQTCIERIINQQFTET